MNSTEVPVSDNAAFSAPANASAYSAGIPAPPPAKLATGSRVAGRLIFWGLWIGAGFIWAGVKHHYAAIEKVAPVVNATIHSGVEDQSDVDYHAEKFWSDYKAFNDVSCKGLDVKGCKALLLAQRPVLDEMHHQLWFMDQAVDKERTNSTLPHAATCYPLMKTLVSSIRTYIGTQQETLNQLAAGKDPGESDADAAIANMQTAYRNAQTDKGEACQGW